MTKYDVQFKLGVVRQYLDGDIGYKALARKHGLSHSMVHRWITWFQAHGTLAPSKKAGPYSADFKLSVLRHMWDNSLSFGQTAILFNLRSSHSISNWERIYRADGPSGLLPRRRGRPKDMTIPTTKPESATKADERPRDELLAELEYLRMENAYLKKLRALVQAKQAKAPLKKRK
jgi:transposase